MFQSPVVVPLVEPWQGLLIVPAAVAGLAAGLRLLVRAGAVHPESVRKGLHVGGGLIALGLPWLFDRVWPLAVLVGFGVIALVVINVRRRLAPAGGLMAGVERKGEVYIGPIYFPLAVVALFALTRSNVLLYWVPLMVLTFADAVAALVGVRYGQHKYQATGGRKSVEGSAAFFLAAFFSAHVPLLLASDLGRTETLLIGVTFGLLLMMVEAVAWSGLDNLFIPLVGYLLLRTYVELPAAALAWRLLVTAGLALIAWAARGRLWNDAGLILAILVGYACANLGGWEWLVVALAAFAGVAWLSPDRERAPVRTVREVGAVCAVPVIWLGIANLLDLPALLAPFAGAFAAHLAMIRYARHACRPSRESRLRIAFECAFDAALVLAVYVVVGRETRTTWAGAAGAAVGTATATLLFAALLGACSRRFNDAGRWWLQATLATLASLGGLAVFLAAG